MQDLTNPVPETDFPRWCETTFEELLSETTTKDTKSTKKTCRTATNLSELASVLSEPGG